MIENIINGEYTDVFAIEDGELLDGKLPNKKQKMVQAWIAIHEEDHHG